MHVRNTASCLRRTALLVALSAWLLLTTGCATNHPFVRGEPLDVPSLVDELESRTAGEGEDALFDVTYLPFAHANVQVFTRNDDTDDYPEGHIFFSVRAWLPLFGFANGEIERYDDEHAAYETMKFQSILWGLWSRLRTTVQTHHGPRTEGRGKLLWLLDWGPYVEYEGAADR